MLYLFYLRDPLLHKFCLTILISDGPKTKVDELDDTGERLDELEKMDQAARWDSWAENTSVVSLLFQFERVLSDSHHFARINWFSTKKTQC